MTEQSTAHSTASAFQTRRVALALAALLVVTAVAYLPGLGGGFVFDDMQNIVYNGRLHVSTTRWQDWTSAIFSSPSSNLQRPLAMLSFAVNHYFTGLDAGAMKATNIAIHLANVLLVFGLINALLRLADACGYRIADRTRQATAMFVSAAWALHPINLMAVLYVVQRMESLSHTFVFAGLWLYVAGRRRQLAGAPGWVLVLSGLVPCTLLGILSKESAALLPLYAFWIECLLPRFRMGASAAASWRLGAMYAAGLLVPGLLAGGHFLIVALQPGAYAGRTFTLVQRLLTEGRIVADYARWTVAPSLDQLSLYHDDIQISRGLLEPASTLACLVGLAAAAMLAWALRRRRPLVALGVSWFLSAQLLTATVIPLELVFEHRNYFASLGLCLLVADLLLLGYKPPFWQGIGRAVAAASVLMLGLSTWVRATEWRDPFSFAATESAKHPDSPRATYELARLYIVATGYRPNSPFIGPAEDALAQARRVPEAGVLPYQASLILAARYHKPPPPGTWSGLQAKLASRPLGAEDAAALQALAECAERKDCTFPDNEMLATFGAALSHGDSPEILNLYGAYAVNVLGDWDLGLKAWREMVRVAPGEAQYRINLATLLMATGRDAECREQITQLRSIGRVGQNDAEANVLERQLAASIRRRGGRPPR